MRTQAQGDLAAQRQIPRQPARHLATRTLGPDVTADEQADLAAFFGQRGQRVVTPASGIGGMPDLCQIAGRPIRRCTIRGKIELINLAAGAARIEVLPVDQPPGAKIIARFGKLLGRAEFGQTFAPGNERRRIAAIDLDTGKTLPCALRQQPVFEACGEAAEMPVLRSPSASSANSTPARSRVSGSRSRTKRRALSGASPSPLVLTTNKKRPPACRSAAASWSSGRQRTVAPLRSSASAVRCARACAVPVWLA